MLSVEVQRHHRYRPETTREITNKSISVMRALICLSTRADKSITDKKTTWPWMLKGWVMQSKAKPTARATITHKMPRRTDLGKAELFSLMASISRCGPAKSTEP